MRARRLTPGPARHGTTLVELLVALPLTLLVAVVAVALLLHVARTGRAQGARLTTLRELRHARLIMSRELEAMQGADLHLLSDTLVEFRSHLGVLVLCEIPDSATMDVAPPDGATGAGWVGTIRAGDDIAAWALSGPPSAPPAPWTGILVQPPSPLGMGPCGPAPLAALRPRWRLTLAAAPSPWLAPGMPLGVGRPVRYRHYQSGTRWWIGRRTRDAVGWDVTQPVAGPILPASQQGMQLQGFTPQGVKTAWPDSVALLRLTLRAPRHLHDAMSPAIDSATVEITLRAAPPKGPPS